MTRQEYANGHDNDSVSLRATDGGTLATPDGDGHSEVSVGDIASDKDSDGLDDREGLNSGDDTGDLESDSRIEAPQQQWDTGDSDDRDGDEPERQELSSPDSGQQRGDSKANRRRQHSLTVPRRRVYSRKEKDVSSHKEGDVGQRGDASDRPEPLRANKQADLVPRKWGVMPIEIPPAKLGHWWPIIRGGVEDVIHKGTPNFLPEDVYSFIKESRAWLIICVNQKTKAYEGFVVLTEELPNTFCTDPDLLIWLAHSKVPGSAELLFPKIEKAAKDKGYKRIAFHSERNGCVKRAKTYGFSLTERVFHKKL